MALKAAFQNELPSLRLLCGEGGARGPIHDPPSEVIQMITRAILTVDGDLMVVTPLEAAVRAKHQEVALALLSMSGQQELRLEGKLEIGGTILHWAAAEGMARVVRALVEETAWTLLRAMPRRTMCCPGRRDMPKSTWCGTY